MAGRRKRGIWRRTAVAGGALAALLCAAPPAVAEVIEPPETFVAEAFGGTPPAPSMLWLTPEIQGAVERILGHPLRALRVRYWRSGGQTAWILEEIGKERPITAGFVINGHAISRVKVLIYRESRGGEVRYDFFTNQFRGMRLDDQNRLNGSVDGISGATLSVNALVNLARLALYFDKAATGQTP